VWSVALKEDNYNVRGVLQSASLLYDHSSRPSSLFQFRLNPLKLELTHRLDRRFGPGRFLEIDIPDLLDHQRPKILKDLGDEGKAAVLEWLVDGDHQILGRTWKPFFTKPSEKKTSKDKAKKKSPSEQDSGPASRLTFFAVDGQDFLPSDGLLDRISILHPLTKISIAILLHYILSVEKNEWQSYLKLFSRISIGF
jgi:hypothetical protein